MKYSLILAASLLFMSLDSEAATLRPHVQVSGDIVTLGDLVDDAGKSSGIALFRAPELGKSGVISAHRVIEAAANQGVFLNEGPDTPAQITVWRESRMIDRKQIETAALSEVRHRNLVDPTSQDDRVSITTIQMSDAVHLPMGNKSPLAIRDFNHDPQTGRFSMAIAVPAPRGGREWSTRVQGQIVRMVEVPVMARAVGRLEIIGLDDIEMTRVDATTIDAATAAIEDIIGQAAKRRLGPGAMVRMDDLTKPILVRRNATVPIVFRSGRLVLTAHGRAISDGSEGDLVRVLNTKSHRVIEGIVQSSGTVAIIPKPIAVASTNAIVQ